MAGNVTVEGIDEVNAALKQVADFNQEAAATEAATALLPSVQSGTRVATGLLASSWNVQEGAFVNEVSYAIPQEFGTESMEGSFAIFGAFDAGEPDVIGAFEKGIESAAKQAGFGTK